jgi:hypothetical protein
MAINPLVKSLSRGVAITLRGKGDRERLRLENARVQGARADMANFKAHALMQSQEVGTCSF